MKISQKAEELSKFSDFKILNEKVLDNRVHNLAQKAFLGCETDRCGPNDSYCHGRDCYAADS